MRFFQAFRHIFTSPSSAAKEETISDVTSRRRDVASTLHMNSQVTPRSIAYTATQVCRHLHITPSVADWSLLKLVFALGSAREWKREHAGFHYPSFYNFIVDYLENPQDEASQRDINELLKWWNQYDLFILSVERDVLTYPFLSSEVFPPAISNSAGAASQDATDSTLKMLEEARARRALRTALRR
jgi:hypothetical protein